MGWGIGFAILLLILLLPLGVRFRYDDQGAQASLLIGFVSIKLFPKRTKEEKKEKKETVKKEQATTQKESTKSGGGLTDFMPLVHTALDFLSDFRRKIRVKKLLLHITLAGGDPDELALNYGKANALLGNMDPFLERYFVIRKKDICFGCDFICDETLVLADVVINITVGRVLWLLLRYGIRALKQLLQIMNLRKGGGLT